MALLDSAFNHPQFAVGLGTGGFMVLTDYLISGNQANGATAVLDADTVGSPEGFSVGLRRPGRPAAPFLMTAAP